MMARAAEEGLVKCKRRQVRLIKVITMQARGQGSNDWYWRKTSTWLSQRKVGEGRCLYTCSGVLSATLLVPQCGGNRWYARAGGARVCGARGTRVCLSSHKERSFKHEL